MDTFPLQLEIYSEQIKNWPSSGRHILAQYDDNSIIVYQAFNARIAKAAVSSQNFCSDELIKAGYNMKRMTWIKPNFLWMMFRAGWATKPNQEHILAIRLTRQGFEDILRQSQRQGDGDVRIQWDPDHDPSGAVVATGRRAIQLGIRGVAKQNFSESYIISIYDITDFVTNQKSAEIDKLIIPKENVYQCSGDLSSIVGTN